MKISFIQSEIFYFILFFLCVSCCRRSLLCWVMMQNEITMQITGRWKYLWIRKFNLNPINTLSKFVPFGFFSMFRKWRWHYITWSSKSHTSVSSGSTRSLKKETLSIAGKTLRFRAETVWESCFYGRHNDWCMLIIIVAGGIMNLVEDVWVCTTLRVDCLESKFQERS